MESTTPRIDISVCRNPAQNAVQMVAESSVAVKWFISRGRIESSLLLGTDEALEVILQAKAAGLSVEVQDPMPEETAPNG